MKKAVLFDLGNTLGEYYESCAYPELLPLCIEAAREAAARLGLGVAADDAFWRAVEAENREDTDHRVRPLEGRLLRLFGRGSPSLPPASMDALCRSFMGPIFALGRCYEDTIPTLAELRRRGTAVAIVSNAPWGCPAALCHEEAARLGLEALADVVVFCTDAGWRKPAPPIFRYALDRLGVAPGESLFVGDHPEWDLEGPRAVGIDAVLLDRRGARSVPGEKPLRTLAELWPLL